MNYEQKYKEALEWMKSLYNGLHGATKEEAEKYFPELKDSEDEQIRKGLIKALSSIGKRNWGGIDVFESIAWLEKQKAMDKDIIFRPLAGTDIIVAAKQALEKIEIGKEVILTFNDAYIPVNGKTVADICNEYFAWLEKQGQKTSWKPSKEEMDVLYGLAYITNQYDEHKEEVITRLYQDLKREFFNGSSYENMFPTNTNTEDEVRRRSIIQVLEYARSLNAYNQYGKEDIDIDIAWLEKQGEQKAIGMKSSEESLGVSSKEYNEIVNECLYGESKPTDKVEPKFKVGDWVLYSGDHYEGVRHITKIDENGYYIERNGLPHGIIPFNHEICMRLWTIQDAKDGDVLAGSKNDVILMFRGIGNTEWDDVIDYHCYYDCYRKDFIVQEDVKYWGNIENNQLKPATKEQRDLLFQKMKEEGYEWDAEKKELKKIVAPQPKFKVGDWIANDYCDGKVIALTDDAYLLDSGQGIPFSCEHNTHLWTIQDAKDGDMLVDVYGNIGIFQKNDDFDWSSYCSLGSNGGFRCFAIEHELDGSHPATKEQRETLMKAMTDAGYQWDAEKKELKKIEDEYENYCKQVLSELEMEILSFFQDKIRTKK